jgi:hypothetical protein
MPAAGALIPYIERVLDNDIAPAKLFTLHVKVSADGVTSSTM